MGPEYRHAETRVLLRYGAAIACVVAAAVLRWLLQPVMGVAPPYITFYLAVAVAAAYGGFGPGLGATVTGLLVGVAITYGTAQRLDLGSAAEQVRITLYLFSGLAISWVARKMHDATNRAAEEAAQMRQLSEELRIANERLVESDRSKDRFVAVVAHELRNPLMPLRNGLDLLNSHGADRELAARTLAIMSRQLDQMGRIVDDLLDASRIRHNKLDLQRVPVDLRDVVARAVDDQRPHYLARGVGLHHHRYSQPVHVYADPARLSQVVGNLLHNALKFTPQHGDVRVDVEREGNLAVLRVRDTGIGIATEALGRIFKPFEQAHEQAPSAGGLGLGLSLVKSIVELHGGAVEASSSGPHQGTEFRVSLPVDVTPLPASSASMPLERVEHGRALPNATGEG
jgi:signal transduction histidine kinase